MVGHCIVQCRMSGNAQTLFHLVVNGDTSEFNAGGNPALAQYPIQGVNLPVTLSVLGMIIVYSAVMTSHALISKINSTLSANQKRDSEFNV